MSLKASPGLGQGWRFRADTHQPSWNGMWARASMRHYAFWISFQLKPTLNLRATSHTILRACDQYTSRTLIGRKGGAGPSSLHTALEGSTEYVNARWMSTCEHLRSTIILNLVSERPTWNLRLNIQENQCWSN